MSTIDSENGVYTRGRTFAIFYQKTGCFEWSKCQMALAKLDFTLSRCHRPGICRFQLDRGCDRAEINVMLGLGWFRVKRLIRKLKISFKQTLQITQGFRVNRNFYQYFRLAAFFLTCVRLRQSATEQSSCTFSRARTNHSLRSWGYVRLWWNWQTR